MSVINVSLALKIGDKVALIAPASGQKKGGEHLVLKALNCLSDWGLVVEGNVAFEPCGYFSNTDKIRYSQLKKALVDPEIKAIFVTRGGYGTARLISFLERDLASFVSMTPKLLIGFSDITLLHLFFTANKLPICCIHGANLATQQFLLEKSFFFQGKKMSNHSLLFEFLFNSKKIRCDVNAIYSSRPMPENWYQLPLTGGCLSIVVNSLGTQFEIDTCHKILMIEEVCESPYVIDRMLTHLKNANKFKKIKGIVFGDLVDCNSRSISAHKMILQYFENENFPVGITDDFGHGAKNIPWIYD